MMVLRTTLAFLFCLFFAPVQAQNVLFPANPGDMIVKGATTWGAVPGGTAGCVLRSNGPTAAPTWQCSLPLNFQLPPIAVNTVLCNVSGAQAPPAACNISQILSTIDYDIQRPPLMGSVPYVGANALWHLAPPATSGWVWTSQGAGANPRWQPGNNTPYSPGATGTCLVSNGLGVDPSYQACIDATALHAANNLSDLSSLPAARVNLALPSWFDTAFCNTVGRVIVRFTSVWTCAKGVPINVQWLGVSGDGTPQTAAMQAALDIQKASGGCLLFPIPAVAYDIGATISSLDGTGPLCMLGEASGAGPGIISGKASIIRASFTTGDMFHIRSYYGVRVENLQFISAVGVRLGGAALHVSGPTSPAHYMSYPYFNNLVFSQQFYGIQQTNTAGGTINDTFHISWAHSAIINDRTDLGIEISLGDITNIKCFGDVAAVTTQITCINITSGYTKIRGGGIGGSQIGILAAPTNSAGQISISQVHIEEQSLVGIAISSLGVGPLRAVDISNNLFTTTNPLVSGSATHSILVDAGVDIRNITISNNIFRLLSSAGTFRAVSVGSGNNAGITNNKIEILGGTHVAITAGANVLAPFLVSDNLLTVTGGSATKYNYTAAPANTVLTHDLQGLTVAQAAALAPALANGSTIYMTNGKSNNIGAGDFSTVAGGQGCVAWINATVAYCVQPN